MKKMLTRSQYRSFWQKNTSEVTKTYQVTKLGILKFCYSFHQEIYKYKTFLYGILWKILHTVIKKDLKDEYNRKSMIES